MTRAATRRVAVDTVRNDRATSLAALATAYAGNTPFAEPWSNLTSWNPNNACQVSGGKLYGLASPPNPYGGAKNVTITSGTRFRYVATIDFLSGGAAHFVGIGICTAAAPMVSALTGTREWGLLTGVPSKGVAGTASNLTKADGTGGGAALTSGAYRVSIVGDETTITVSITDAARTVEYVDTVAWATAGTQASITFRNGDARATPGTALRGLYFQGALTTASPRGVYEDTGSAVVLSGSSTSALQVRVPSTYDSTVPCPVVMFHHGHGGTEAEPVSSFMASTTTALLAAGYIVASVNAGTTNWGNQAAVDTYAATYAYLRDHFCIGPVMHLGQSMGGLTSLLTLAQRKVPAAAWAGIYPVCSLANMYANATYTSAIDAAYSISGGNYSTQTVAHDPMLLDARSFRGLPMRFYASPSDTTVTKTANSDAFSALVASNCPESTVVPHTGNHGDASAYQPADLIAFFDRYRYEPTLIPTAPTALTTSIASGQVTVGWTAAAPRGSAITDYIIQYRTTSGPGAWTTFADGTSTTASATVTGLTNGTSYDFQVAAVNGVGQGAYSAPTTATPASVPAPGGVSSGLVWWFKADAITGLSDGAAVATWPDASLNANDLTQATGGKQPVYKTSIINGSPVVRFNGSTSLLARPYNAAWNTAEWTIFAVCLPQGGAGGFRAALASAPSGGTGGYTVYASSGNTYQWFLTNSASPGGSGSAAVGAAHITSATKASTPLVTVYQDGTSNTTSSTTFTTNTTGDLLVGSVNTTGTFTFNGDVAELIYFNRVLTGTELTNVHRYLGTKYAITVP